MNNNQKPQKLKDQKKQLNKYLVFSGTAFQMLATIALGVFIGYKLDERYPNKYQLFTIIFSFLFIGIALYAVIKQASKFIEQEDNND